MPLADEESEQAAKCRQRSRDGSRGNAGRAQRLKKSNDVLALHGVERAFIEPFGETPQIGSVCSQRILCEPLLDSQIVEIEQQEFVHRRELTRSAMYELRTNGPEKTARKPSCSPSWRYSSKTDGCTYSTTSSFSRFGCRYCPIVRISHPL